MLADFIQRFDTQISAHRFFFWWHFVATICFAFCLIDFNFFWKFNKIINQVFPDVTAQHTWGSHLNVRPQGLKIKFWILKIVKILFNYYWSKLSKSHQFRLFFQKLVTNFMVFDIVRFRFPRGANLGLAVPPPAPNVDDKFLKEI